jgi:hypothetical protein
MKENQNHRICCGGNYENVCPIFNAHDKLQESFFFLLQLADAYHFAAPFRFYLNAFLQSLRSVTMMLQTYKEAVPNFDEWYQKKQEEMRSNDLLARMCNARTVIVHKGALQTKSTATVGVYRGREPILALTVPVKNPFIDSSQLLSMYSKFLVGKGANLFWLDEEHSEPGEQLGIKRCWIADNLGNEEVLSLCLSAYQQISDVIKEAHKLCDFTFAPSTIDFNYFQSRYVLLESDVDPSLHKKWGW